MSGQVTLLVTLRARDDDGRFMFYEVWRDQAALDAHARMPYLVRWNSINKELLAEPPQLSLWRKHEA